MISRPLRCPLCEKFDWAVLRAANTGKFALEWGHRGICSKSYSKRKAVSFQIAADAFNMAGLKLEFLVMSQRREK
jgi:hypothetical protein